MRLRRECFLEGAKPSVLSLSLPTYGLLWYQASVHHGHGINLCGVRRIVGDDD